MPVAVSGRLTNCDCHNRQRLSQRLVCASPTTVEEAHMTEYDRLLKAGDYLKLIINEAQNKVSVASHFLNCEYPDSLTEEQLAELQDAIIQATINVVAYRDLLRRLYEAIGVPNPAELCDSS